MKRFVFGFVFLYCAFCYQARAIVPLEIKAIVTLPILPHYAIPPRFDIQHCADDTSLGYAYVLGDTIYWANRIGDVEGSYAIPLDSFPPHSNSEYGEGLVYQQLNLLHLESQGNHLCVLLQSETKQWSMGGPAYVGKNVFMLIDLESQQLLTVRRIAGSSSSVSDGYGCGTGRRPRDITLWPPLPDVSSMITFVRGEGTSCNGHSGRYSSQSEGVIFKSDLLADGFSIDSMLSGTRIIPFADFTQFFFAIEDHFSYESFDEDNFPPSIIEGTTAHRFGTASLIANPVFNLSPKCSLSHGSIPPINRCPDPYLAAQHDANGTNRIISHMWNWGVCAINATQIDDTLWYNPAIIGAYSQAGTLQTARLNGTADERILSLSTETGKFGIFSGSTGEFLDSTSAYVGTMAYIIKQPNLTDEFVAYEYSTITMTTTIRVYGSLPQIPNGVEQSEGLQPASFSLSVFPNPFNPSTTLSFPVPATGRVTLRIFDLLGREVATLVDGMQTAGTHSVLWNATHQPTGIYLSLLECSSQRRVNKLMLIK